VKLTYVLFAKPREGKGMGKGKEEMGRGREEGKGKGGPPSRIWKVQRWQP